MADLTVAAVQIGVVEPGSATLAEVRTLWRRDSGTLGFFPDGAFDDHARNGWILAARSGDGVVGYLLYRITGRSQAAIVHLCVADAARGGGLARRLFDAMLKRVSNCTDVVLRCRRDFAAHRVWPRLGFVARGDQKGRGGDGAVLTVYRYAIQQPPLLALLGGDPTPDRTQVVVDANVFFDLDDETPGREESRSLAADWLSEFIDLCVTDEIFNEINRRENSGDRARQRERVREFTLIEAAGGREDDVFREVRALLGGGASDSAMSDARQVARTITANRDFFVTRDTNILAAADALQERYGLSVLQPHDVILRFDEIRRVDHYRPRRSFVGPRSREASARSGDVDAIAALLPTDPDRRRRVAELRELLAMPDKVETLCVRVEDALLAAFALDRRDPDMLMVPFFVVADTALGAAAARHYAHQLPLLAADEGRSVVRVRPSGAGAHAGLVDARYVRADDTWVKACFRVVAPISEIAHRLGQIPELVALRDALASHPQPPSDVVLDAERAVWPAKFLDTQLPCFVVPIRPKWAAQLFDHELAAGSLWGANGALALNSENAYYRAARPSVLCAPGRILWYVSDDSAEPGTMAIRATSYLDEVVTAPPKEAFRAFRHLGVYRWQDVFAIAKQDLTANVQAFRFSKTEPLRPVPFNDVRELLARYGRPNQQFQSPVSIPEAAFFELYERGTRRSGAA